MSSAIAAAHRIALAMGEQGARAEGVRLSHTAVGITVAVLRESVIHVAQVGMSRLYRKRRDVIELLLLDHSLPSAFLRQYGSESREYLDALDFHRTAVARMLGLVPDVDADYVTEPLEDGDCFLICSGGIWNQPEGDLLVRTLFDAAPEGFGPVVTAACSGLDVAALRFRAAATPTASV
ncbi:MAG: hypothetical protein HOW73_06740 [Polyangiaceae bacterium]|nr:hypothetical protein [Polyangiaceae bacterium]